MAGELDPFAMLDEIDGDLLTWWAAHRRLKNPEYCVKRRNELIAETDPDALLQMQIDSLKPKHQ